MRRSFCLILLTAWLAACSPAAPTATAAPTAVVDIASLESGAVEFVRQLSTGEYILATGNFDAAMQKAAPAAALEGLWQQTQNQYGAFVSIVGTRNEKQAGYQIIYVTCQFENFPLDIKVVYDSSGKIAGLFMQPSSGAYTPPDYADPQKFTEQEVTIGSGEWALPGTVTMPVGDGPFPAVVLVHGSGPNDRDETLYANKPFKDIAWGLASRGIVVLRYDKRTYVYSEKFTAEVMESFTLDDETVDDALLAVELLRTNPVVDPQRIFVLGHSQGGMALPRIGSRDAQLAGLISMAGPSRPLGELALEQYTYLFGLDGGLSAEEQVNLTILQQQAELTQSASLSVDTPAASLLFGIPAVYWLDLRDYRPAEMAAKLLIPMLILQGGRDYQVTDADLEGWRTQLADRADVTLKLYTDLNHLFMVGQGRATPQEYLSPGYVDLQVIEEIAAWIGR